MIKPELAPYYRNAMLSVSSSANRTEHEALRQWRRDHGLTQKDMATCLGISVRMYQYYEAGEREDGRKVEVPTMLWLALLHFDELIDMLYGEPDQDPSSSGTT